MGKSVAVVLGSYVLSIVLVLGTDPLLTRLFPGDYVRERVPSNSALLVSTLFFVVISVLCAWVCARFAPSRAGRHVLWFFILGEVLGLATAIPGWSKGWPHWYSLSWLLSWPVTSWIGLLLSGRRGDRVSSPAI